MVHRMEAFISEQDCINKVILVFGYCSASIEIIDWLSAQSICVSGILDNSDERQRCEYKGIKVIRPQDIYQVSRSLGKDINEDFVIFIASRFYESMKSQLRQLGYNGPILKVIDYNTYSDYSLEDTTIESKMKRRLLGDKILHQYTHDTCGRFKVFFPYNALGDVYIAMSYWAIFAKNKQIRDVIFFVLTETLKSIVEMFGEYDVKVVCQKEMDAMVQSSLYCNDKSSYIVHQDRPYVVNLHEALYIKCIPLEQIYCCGIYGLPKETIPQKPSRGLVRYAGLDGIPKRKSVIFSPHAKSVTAIKESVWILAVNYYTRKGYECFTNVVGDEKPLDGTKAISPSILEIQSVVEHAGTFIGIRSGLCDVIRDTKAKKIVLYPDYNYSDTKWKAIEMYKINQFDYNILATEEIKWETL